MTGLKPNGSVNLLLESVTDEKIKKQLNFSLKYLKDILQNINNNDKIKIHTLEQIRVLENSINEKTNKNSIISTAENQQYKKYIDIQIKKLRNLNHKITNYFPQEMTQDKDIQKAIHQLLISEIIFLEENDINMISVDQFKKINHIFFQYKMFLNINEYNFDKLITVNYQLNDIMNSININSQNFFQFIMDYNQYSHYYNGNKMPLLKKK